MPQGAVAAAGGGVKPVIIEWQDAHFAAEEITLEEAAKVRPEPTVSVGYPVEADGCILLFMSAFKDHPDRMAEYLAIPSGMVVSVRELAPVPPYRLATDGLPVP